MSRRGRKLSKGVAWCRRMSQGVTRCRSRMKGRLAATCNVYFLLKMNSKLVSDHAESGRSETQLGIVGRQAVEAEQKGVRGRIGV